MHIGGFTFGGRDSGGGFGLVSYHPRNCPTWHWYLSVIKSRVVRRWWIVSIAPRRQGQWHHYLRLPFGLSLCLGRQDYHLNRKVA